jgi:hypothetical protein
MSGRFQIDTVCECQALLGAELDGRRLVVRGWATALGGVEQELAPAQSIGADAERFDVTWHCPSCGRSVLRSFHAGALSRLEQPG